MTSSNGNIFRVTGHLRGEFLGHRWIPRTKASDAELWCFLSLICAWINGWVNNREADDLRRPREHYVTVMKFRVNDGDDDVILLCMSLQWRQCVSNHRRLDCLLSRLSWRRSKTGEFPHKGQVTRRMFPFDDVIPFYLNLFVVVFHSSFVSLFPLFSVCVCLWILVHWCIELNWMKLIRIELGTHLCGKKPNCVYQNV